MYGPSIQALKENKFKYNSNKINTYYIQVMQWVLNSNNNVKLARDTMFIGNMISLFVTISLNLKFKTW